MTRMSGLRKMLGDMDGREERPVWLRFFDPGPDATVRLDARRTRVGKLPKDEGAGVLVVPLGKVR